MKWKLLGPISYPISAIPQQLLRPVNPQLTPQQQQQPSASKNGFEDLSDDEK